MDVGGAERQLSYLAEGLVRQGHEVHVAMVFRGRYTESLEGAGATIHVLDGSRYDPRVVTRLTALVREVRPDVVNTWLTQMDIFGGLVTKWLGIPWVLSERSTAAAYPPSLLHRLREWMGRRADAVIANSSGGMDYWRDHTSSDIHLVPNIVPLEQIERTSAVTDDVGIEEHEKVALFVGRLSAEKNLGKFLEAMAIARERRDLTAVLCGDGPLRPALEQRARELGLGSWVRFPGSVPNPWSWLKRADVVVAVSTFEGNPNVALEAAAVGAPLVVSDIPAYREILGADCARFVDPNDAEAIAQAIVDVSSDAAAARARAERARWCVAGRSVGEIAARYEDIYRQVTNGRPRMRRRRD